MASALWLGRYTYKISSETAVEEGSYVSISMSNGLEATGLVLERVYNDLTKIYDYAIRSYDANYIAVAARTVRKSSFSNNDANTVAVSTPKTPVFAVTGDTVFWYPIGDATPVNTSIVLTGTPAETGYVPSSYQWYYRTALGADTILSGETNATLTLDYNDAWYYSGVTVFLLINGKHSFYTMLINSSSSSYLGESLTTPTFPAVGDYYFYTGSTGGGATQYTMRRWTGIAWALDSAPAHNNAEYSLGTNPSSMNRSNAGVYSPVSMLCTLSRKLGTAPYVLYSGRFIVAETTDGTNYTDVYTSSSDEASHLHVPGADVKTIRVRAYLAGGVSTLLSEKAVTVSTEQIADGSIGATKFVSTLKPVEIVDTLPTTGNVEGRMVYLTSSKKLYRFDGTAFVASVPTTDLTGFVQAAQIQADSITANQIASGTITAAEMAADSITANNLQVGSRAQSNVGLEGFWSMEAVPEIPDNAAGIVGGYLQDTWATTDSFAGSGTLSVANGTLIQDCTAGQFNSRALSSSLGIFRIKVKQHSGTLGTLRIDIAGGTQTNPADLALSRDYKIFDIPFTGTMTSMNLLIAEYASQAYGLTVDFIYVGSGLYDTLLVDNSGNGNAGTIYGATPVPGISGKGLSFNGAGNHVAATAIIGSTVSISVWVKPANVAASRVVFGATGDFRLYISAAHTLGVYSTSLGDWPFLAGLTTGVWCHIVYSTDNTTESVYVNGFIVASRTASRNISATAIDIGSILGYYAAETFNGIIDEPRIYSRALTIAEIRALYENPGGSLAGMIKADQIIVSELAADTAFVGSLTAQDLTVRGTISADHVYVARGAFSMDKFYPARF
jgi:hypothetical protein